MAVVRSIALGKARNSAGNLTFQVYGGQTIAREKPASVKNPRTPAQLAQRSKMTNLVEAWRNQFVTLKNFFTAKAARLSEYNLFTRLNMPYAETPLVNESGALQELPTGVYLASGKYPEHFIAANLVDANVEVEVTNIALLDELMEGDVIAIIEYPDANGNIGVSETVLTENDVDDLKAGSTIEIPYTGESDFKVIWYSPSRRVNTSARV